VLNKYSDLSEDEIKDIVIDDKWLAKHARTRPFLSALGTRAASAHLLARERGGRPRHDVRRRDHACFSVRFSWQCSCSRSSGSP
jgi:hypothetical protein